MERSSLNKAHHNRPWLWEDSRQNLIQHFIGDIDWAWSSVLFAPESLVPRHTAMSVVIATIPISVVPVPANVVQILIPGPFDQRAAINRDPDVVIRSAAKGPAALPGAVPSNVEEVAGQSRSHEDSCRCKLVELHREVGSLVDGRTVEVIIAGGLNNSR